MDEKEFLETFGDMTVREFFKEGERIDKELRDFFSQLGAK